MKSWQVIFLFLPFCLQTPAISVKCDTGFSCPFLTVRGEKKLQSHVFHDFTARLLQRTLLHLCFVQFGADIVPDGLDELNQGNEDDDRCRHGICLETLISVTDSKVT